MYCLQGCKGGRRRLQRRQNRGVKGKQRRLEKEKKKELAGVGQGSIKSNLVHFKSGPGGGRPAGR